MAAEMITSPQYTRQEFSLYIGGKAVKGAATMPVINPATEATIALCPRADLAQLNEAVAQAKSAFKDWSKTPIGERRGLLLKIADAVEGRTNEIAQLITAEQGKTIGDATGEVMGTVYMMRTLAQLDLPVEVLKEDANGKVVLHRTPLGVVAAITPWNVPLVLLAIKTTPALLAGNTVVAKPAPTTPLSSLVFGEICNGILPPGVFNVVTDLNDLGGHLTNHPDVAKISFTGSTATGRKVLQSGASAFKRVTLELGGNDAAIVLDDVDPKAIAPKLFAAAMINSGQICLAAKRVYVPESMYEAICEELATLARETVIGNGMDPKNQYGPVQNKAQYEKVKAYIESARKDGRIIAGGEIPEGPGYFIRPTIVRDIPDEASLVCEEQFGPVLPVLKYKTIDEVIERANKSDYGLGGTVWTKDPKRGLEVAMKLDSGLLWVNQHMTVDPGISTGGAKHSGIGRELGPEGLHEFTQAHTIYVANSF
jgi:acyl-CoA reductase-like NAD-dependent aldehyde dehydrogenase